MKKFFLLSVTAIIASGTFVSCNQNEIEKIPFEGRSEVSFSSNIIKVIPPIKTRMAGNLWAVNDPIGIYMLEEESTAVVEDMRNIKYVSTNTGEDGIFEADEVTIFFPDNGNKVRFMSYFPYTASITDDTYQVDVTDQTSQSAIDLLYSFNEDAKYDKTSSEKKVILVFNHKLAKININIKAGEGLEKSDLDNIKVHFEKFNRKAEFDLISGNLNNITDNGNIIPAEISPKQNYSASYEAIIIPELYPNTSMIVFDLNNGDSGDSDVFTWKFKNDELGEGNEYTYNVTVNRSGIIVEATINDWIPNFPEDIKAE